MEGKRTDSKRAGCDYCGFSRREFLAAGAVCAAALQSGVASFAEPAGSSAPAASVDKTLVKVAFLRPEKIEDGAIYWPGAFFDTKARTADYTKVLADAAKELGVKLDVHPKPLWDDAAFDAFCQGVKESNSQGVILVLEHLNHNVPQLCGWIQRLADTPTILFSPMGTSFHNHLLAMKPLSDKQRMYFASTPDYRWLGFGVRIFHTIWQMGQTRICVVRGEAPKDVVLKSIGTTLRYVPFTTFSDEYKKVEETDEVRAMAAAWERSARKVVEPSKKDIVEAAKTYVVCRRLMDATGCQGIAVDCLPHVKGRTAPPPCMAFMQLNDEGVVAACQSDWPAAVSLRLSWLLLSRPGFMNNMCSSTVDNALVGAHCTCPTLLAGPGQPPAPYLLRTHAESNLGVAPQVLWPEGEQITVMKFADPAWFAMPAKPEEAAGTIWLGSGRVMTNIDTPPSGGCRTSLEAKLDGVDRIEDVRMLHHMLYVLGEHKEKIEAYCELAGLKAESLTG